MERLTNPSLDASYSPPLAFPAGLIGAGAFCIASGLALSVLMLLSPVAPFAAMIITAISVIPGLPLFIVPMLILVGVGLIIGGVIMLLQRSKPPWDAIKSESRGQADCLKKIEEAYNRALNCPFDKIVIGTVHNEACMLFNQFDGIFGQYRSIDNLNSLPENTLLIILSTHYDYDFGFYESVVRLQAKELRKGHALCFINTLGSVLNIDAKALTKVISGEAISKNTKKMFFFK